MSTLLVEILMFRTLIVGLSLLGPVLARSSAQEKDANAWVNKGFQHVLKDELVEAERCYKKALALDPKNALAHGNLTAVYLRTKRYKETVESGTNAYRLGCKHQGVYLNRGTAYLHLGASDRKMLSFALDD